MGTTVGHMGKALTRLDACCLGTDLHHPSAQIKTGRLRLVKATGQGGRWAPTGSHSTKSLNDKAIAIKAEPRNYFP